MPIYLNEYLEKCQLRHPFHSGFCFLAPRGKKLNKNWKPLTSILLQHVNQHALKNYWLAAMNKSQVSGVVFLDLRKAFDLVDHNILLKRLTISFKNECSRSI